MVRYYEYATSQEAWEKLNELFFLESEELLETGASRMGNQLIDYNVFVKIRTSWVDPKFDFGNTFGYKIQKWSGLVNNYINANYLDVLKAQVLEKELKKYPNYNISMPFDNSHRHGKNCLLSLTVSRRPNIDIPIITFHLRSSEITKRLLVDFLLVQRVVEHIYGENARAEVHLFVVNMYQNVEAFTMYDIHKNIDKIYKRKGVKGSLWADKVIEVLHKFKSVDPLDITYKSFRRAANQLQQVHGDIPMLAGELYLYKRDIEYPEDCITVKQRRAYKRKLKNK